MSLIRPAATLAVLAALTAPAAARAATWTPPTTITTSGAVQFDLAIGAGGTAAIAYVHDGVRVSIKRPGHAWSTPRRVSDGRYGVTDAAVAVDGRGDVVAGWVQNGTRSARGGPVVGPLTIRAAIRHGATWGAPRQLGTSGHFSAVGLDAAANARGDAILVWRGVQAVTAKRRVEAVQSSFRAGGGAFGHAQTVREQGYPRAVSGQVVALDDRGTAHVAWTHEPGPVVRLASRSRGAGGSWGVYRSAGGVPSSNPAITATADRTAILAWRAAQLDSEGNGTQAGALDTAARLPGGTLTRPRRLSSAATRTYRLAAAPSGETLLAFFATGDADTPPTPALGLRVATRPAGGDFGAPIAFGAIRPADFAGGAGYLGDGTALYAWGRSDRVRVIARPAGGAFDLTPELDRPGLYPRIAASGTRALVAFNVARGGGVSIVAAQRR